MGRKKKEEEEKKVNITLRLKKSIVDSLKKKRLYNVYVENLILEDMKKQNE